jgi:hypothetical protein
MEKQLSDYTGNIGYFAHTEFGPNIFRFGYTESGRSPYERWLDSDYNKCRRPSTLPHEFYKLGTHKDHEVHKLLKACPGVRVRLDLFKSPEIFECDFGMEHAKALVESLVAVVTGAAEPLRAPLASRPYQHAFVEMFKASRGDFCLFAKCRSGKSVMTLLAATESDYRSVLVVSYRTSAANSWRDDARRYTVFHEWDVINLASKSWKEEIKSSKEAGRRQLLVSTVQRQREEFGYVKNVAKLYPAGIDLLALDECHIGGESKEFQLLKKNLRYSRLLEISGTAYKTIWKYPRENVYVWGYVEEQRAKAEGYEWAQSLPRMELVLAKYNAADLGAIYGDDPDALKNVFTTVKGKWQDAGSVQAFLRKFFPYGSMVRKQQQMLHGSQHIVMTLPSVEACYLFAESLKDFGSPFSPMVITGDSGNGQADILKHVRSHEATICLTRWANVVGVTVPQWDTVIHGCEYDSAEFWVQFAFRGGSTTRDSWKVIDLAPERGIQSVLDMASATSAADGEEDASSVLRTLMEFADVFEFSDGYKSLDYSQVVDLGLASVDSAKAESRAAMAEVTYGSNIDLIAYAFEGKDKVKAQTLLNSALNENGTAAEGNVQLSGQAEADTDSVNKKAALAAVKAAVGKLDDVIADGLLFDTHLSTLPQVLSYGVFEAHTGCHPDLFRLVIENGWVNPHSLNSRISRIHMSLSTALQGAL